MSVAEEVARLEAENTRLRAALKQVVVAIQGAAEALGPVAESETPVITEREPPKQQAEQNPLPEQEVVKRSGVSDGAYKVDASSVLGGRMI